MEMANVENSRELQRVLQKRRPRNAVRQTRGHNEPQCTALHRTTPTPPAMLPPPTTTAATAAAATAAASGNCCLLILVMGRETSALRALCASVCALLFALFTTKSPTEQLNELSGCRRQSTAIGKRHSTYTTLGIGHWVLGIGRFTFNFINQQL
ncbi:hypothetical protein AWZ03_007243 [Drosophila navojoa]|uniref:Uncharacterized protein n=1 Tax=Drosophila navojoa TaxID=7232 RepID=A0A484BCF3_DRONA|nr:hypothetical protein AWZ03_007243 [Drosophila navojoa]